MYPCERVGLELIESARFRSTNSVDLNVTPSQLWQVLEDAESWPRWSMLTKMTWISPRPYQVGSTRAIEMRGGARAVEEVIAWHPQSHLAFRMNQISEGIAGASVEEHRIEATAQGCRLTWTLAHDPKDPPLLDKLIAKRVMNHQYRQYLAKLRQYTDSRFGRTIY
ncbi:SRPBCC family protein [Mycolicibacterium stellerae]|uniref:SRPBCC family protein n=1 Tax=Mycolicibacterium stellerae TaxID=2358193 RepID=UPI000F0B7CE0|nr:SRPBCC family protein [Mycolicibacterium stellerae]